MELKSILVFALIAVLLIGVVSFDDAFAKDHKEPKPTKLQKECAKEPKKDNKIKTHCELLNIINALQEDQAGKNDQIDALIAALEAKDMALMDEDAALITNLNLKIEILSAAMQMDDSVCNNIPNADKISDTTLGQLCDQADVWIANYEALCNNVPLFDDAIGIVDTSVVAVLGGTNTALDGVNIVIIALKGFSTGFELDIPDINIGLGSIDLGLLGIISLGTIDIPLPTITFLGITPFSFLETIPTIPGDTIGIVDVKLNQVADCSII